MATSIYTPMQAVVAAQCGAVYIEVRINQVDATGSNGIALVKQVHDFLKNNDIEAELLVSDFKNAQQIFDVCSMGVGSVSIKPNIIHSLISDSIKDSAEALTVEFEKFAGKDKSMIDFK